MAFTIAVDFDGVIHGYSKGWRNGEIYDPPKSGAAQAMQQLLDLGFEVVIWSTRCHSQIVNGVEQPSQAAAVQAYLKHHQIPYSRIHTAGGKPLCVLLIDDRAIHFTSWNQALADSIAFLKQDGTLPSP